MPQALMYDVDNADSVALGVCLR